MPATGAIGSTRSGRPCSLHSVVRSALKSTSATVSPARWATHPGNLYSPGAASGLIASTLVPRVSSFPLPKAAATPKMIARTGRQEMLVRAENNCR